MGKNDTNEMRFFNYISSDEQFMANYLYTFMDRFVYSSADIEGITKEENRKQLIDDLMEALKLAMSKQKITPYDIIDIGNIVNRTGGFSGIRKINVSAGNIAEFTPVSPNQILFRLYDICAQYRDLWCELDPYLREAYFHISLMRTHPFEDGNKRTTKILLTANLISNGCAPIIISKTDLQEYYQYLNTEDYEKMALFIKNRSLSELQNMIGIYKMQKNIPINQSLDSIITKDEEIML